MSILATKQDTREIPAVYSTSLNEIDVRVDRDLAYTVPQGTRQIKVTAGLAWLSYDGIDIILPAGEILTVSSPAIPLILSPLEGAAVTVRITGS